MIKEIDHIGIAVRDLDEAIGTYADILGYESGGKEVLEEQKVTVATIMVGGVRIELLQTTHPDGPIGRFIEKRGEGVHHIAYRVENIDEFLIDLKQKGTNLIDENARTGAGGTRIAFIHPKATNGVLTELVERTD